MSNTSPLSACPECGSPIRQSVHVIVNAPYPWEPIDGLHMPITNIRPIAVLWDTAIYFCPSCDWSMPAKEDIPPPPPRGVARLSKKERRALAALRANVCVLPCEWRNRIRFRPDIIHLPADMKEKFFFAEEARFQGDLRTWATPIDALAVAADLLELPDIDSEGSPKKT